jgi:hypothetical protein
MITRRRMLAAGGGLAALAGEGAAQDQNDKLQHRKANMQITRSGSQASQKGSDEYFTGSVRVDSRFQGSPPARVGGGTVTFEPGARTAWHTHPLGQTLIVTSGRGWVQVEGGRGRRSCPAISSGFLPARSIGMGPPTPRR